MLLNPTSGPSSAQHMLYNIQRLQPTHNRYTHTNSHTYTVQQTHSQVHLHIYALIYIHTLSHRHLCTLSPTLTKCETHTLPHTGPLHNRPPQPSHSTPLHISHPEGEERQASWGEVLTPPQISRPYSNTPHREAPRYCRCSSSSKVSPWSRTDVPGAGGTKTERSRD